MLTFVRTRFMDNPFCTRFARDRFQISYKNKNKIFLILDMGSKCIFRNLAVGCWNIQGLYEKVNGVKLCKLDEVEFQETLRKFDILCLQETHCSTDEKLPQFEEFRSIPPLPK